MSGVYISGMEMPSGCAECPLEMYYFNTGETRCRATNKTLETSYCPTSYEKRDSDCPLVPVPPHGRLGDLDALYEKFVRLENEAMQALKTTNAGSVNWIKWSAILTERTGYKFDIADAPTIIPAEEGEK